MTMPTSDRDLDAAPAKLDLEVVSLEWEKQTLYDSIDTIKRVYTQSPSGAINVSGPDVRLRRRTRRRYGDTYIRAMDRRRCHPQPSPTLRRRLSRSRDDSLRLSKVSRMRRAWRSQSD